MDSHGPLSLCLLTQDSKFWGNQPCREFLQDISATSFTKINESSNRLHGSASPIWHPLQLLFSAGSVSNGMKKNVQHAITDDAPSLLASSCHLHPAQMQVFSSRTERSKKVPSRAPMGAGSGEALADDGPGPQTVPREDLKHRQDTTDFTGSEIFEQLRTRWKHATSMIE